MAEKVNERPGDLGQTETDSAHASIESATVATGLRTIVGDDNIPDRANAAKLGRWLGVLGSVVTIALTAWNVYAKYQIDATEGRLKVGEFAIHERLQGLEESKAKMARYDWVRSHLSDLQDTDRQKRFVSMALIRLALEPREATALFGGLAQSPDQSLQEVGQLGIVNLENEVTGSIEEPTAKQSVGKTFRCSGVVTGLQPGLGLWLAVEKGDGFWPKESRPVVGADNKWTASVFEDGAAGKFSISLFVADQGASKGMQDWLNISAQTGSYREIKSLQGIRRVARIDGLQVIP